MFFNTAKFWNLCRDVAQEADKNIIVYIDSIYKKYVKGK